MSACRFWADPRVEGMFEVALVTLCAIRERLEMTMRGGRVGVAVTAASDVQYEQEC